MRKPVMAGSILLMIMLAITAPCFAGSGMHRKGGGGWGVGSSYNSMYDPATIETISGKVERIDAITPVRGMSLGVRLKVKTDKGLVSVHLGPQWYLRNQDVFIMPDDWVEITGSRVLFERNPAIIAKEVAKGDQVLKLRDDGGIPAWSGWRKRQGKFSG